MLFYCFCTGYKATEILSYSIKNEDIFNADVCSLFFLEV